MTCNLVSIKNKCGNLHTHLLARCPIGPLRSLPNRPPTPPLPTPSPNNPQWQNNTRGKKSKVFTKYKREWSHELQSQVTAHTDRSLLFARGGCALTAVCDSKEKAVKNQPWVLLSQQWPEKKKKKKGGLEMCCLIAVMAALVVVMGAGGGAIVLVEITVVRASILERKSPLPSRPHQSPPTSTISFPLAMMSPCPTHTCRKILYSHRNKYSPCELWHTGFQKICGTDALRCAWKCGFGSAKLPSLNILIKDRMYYSRTSAPENNTA